ncbi:hypothetical protein [Streptomyces sp. NPDC089799]|uniref:hypothetical protein n=1 Tax=Streptomyces sp. NPDC089799 TaxID=3155066 RepID=UPI00343F7753
MPRGRHRNPEPLHRLLTPSAIAGVSFTSAVVAWVPEESLVLRLLAALAAACGIAGAVFLRTWDRAAGRRVAELARERTKDEWRTEERIAELESDLEESRALRAKLDTKLRAKRVELAGLRGEHAALLRRYATAETERASALEGRRLLAIEAGGAGAKDGSGAPAPKEIAAATEERTAAGAATALGYARAHAALSALARKGERELPAAKTPTAPALPEAPAAHAAAEAPEAPAPVPPTGLAAPAATVAAPSGLPARRRPATIAPYAASRRPASRAEGGFDFFGTKAGGGPGTGSARARAAIEAVQHEDLADVVGEEALAAHKAASTTPARPAGAPEATAAAEAVEASEATGAADTTDTADAQVIDLTEHDETEPIDVGTLRTAIS